MCRGTLLATSDVSITGLEQIEQAQAGQLTFIGSRKYLKFWEQSQASAALVSESLELSPGNRSLIQVASADLAIAQVLELFAPAPLHRRCPRDRRGGPYGSARQKRLDRTRLLSGA